MILFLAVIALALVLGAVLGGNLRGIERLHLRWWFLAIAGLGLQFVPLPDGRGGADLAVRIAVLGTSYLMLILFCVANVRLPGVRLLLVGLALNAAVIIPNGGMPVSVSALERSGQGAVLHELLEEGAAKHHLMTEDDVLTFLSDVIPVGGPIHQVVSVGDVLVYAGLVMLVVAAMRGRIPERTSNSEERGRYRGRHRLGSVASPGARTAALASPPAATTSGTGP